MCVWEYLNCCCCIVSLWLRLCLWPLYLFALYQKTGQFILNLFYKNLFCWKQVKYYNLSGNLFLHESPFKTYFFEVIDFTLFSIYILKMLRGSKASAKVFKGWNCWHFAYLFQFDDDASATQMVVHKTLLPFHTIKRMPHIMARDKKMRFFSRYITDKLHRLSAHFQSRELLFKKALPCAHGL